MRSAPAAPSLLLRHWRDRKMDTASWDRSLPFRLHGVFVVESVGNGNHPFEPAIPSIRLVASEHEDRHPARIERKQHADIARDWARLFHVGVARGGERFDHRSPKRRSTQLAVFDRGKSPDLARSDRAPRTRDRIDPCTPLPTTCANKNSSIVNRKAIRCAQSSLHTRSRPWCLREPGPTSRRAPVLRRRGSARRCRRRPTAIQRSRRCRRVARGCRRR